MKLVFYQLNLQNQKEYPLYLYTKEMLDLTHRHLKDV